MIPPRRVFVTGGTGFIGVRLVEALLSRGHHVRAVAREGALHRVPIGAERVAGDALDGSTYASRVAPCDTLVHLVGVAHPTPSMEAEFRRVDLASLRIAVDAAKDAGVAHVVALGVAQPAPVMRRYVAVRNEAEAYLRASGLPATIVRPWYVLGPGRRWPLILLPLYGVAALVPAGRAAARRLGFVGIGTMVAALVHVVEKPANGMRVLGVQDIRRWAGSGA